MEDSLKNKIVSIYDKCHVGVTVLQNILHINEVLTLRDIFKDNVEKFCPLEFGCVTRWDLTENDLNTHSALRSCSEAFRRIIVDISKITNLNPVYQTKFSVLFYPADSSGIKPHRDSEHSVNCVVIFIVSGENSFLVSRDKTCTDVIEFPTQSGDAIIMRGPRNIADSLTRPIHYINKVSKPRYVMVCRHINLEKLK